MSEEMVDRQAEAGTPECLRQAEQVDKFLQQILQMVQVNYNHL